MTNNLNQNDNQISDIELTNEDLYPSLSFVTPEKYIDQSKNLWYGFYTMIQKLLDEDYIELDYIPEIEDMFGSIPEDQKFNWMRDYEAGLVQSSLFGAIGQADLEQQHANQLTDDVFNLVPDDRKVEFLELLFDGNIPQEIASQIEYAQESSSPEDVMARYRENGLTLSSGSKSTFANNNQVAMTTAQLSDLLDKMPGINQELKTQIREQPVISTKVASGEPSQSDNPFINFGDRINRVIDNGAKTTPQASIVNENQVEATTASPLNRASNPNRTIPTVDQRPQQIQPQRSNTNLVNQVPTRNPAQSFSLPSIPSGGSTISRLTQARRASVTNEQMLINQPNQVEATATSTSNPIQSNSPSNPVPSNPLNPQSPNSPAQILKNAIRAKKIAEANQTPQLIRPNRPPTVSL